MEYHDSDSSANGKLSETMVHETSSLSYDQFMAAVEGIAGGSERNSERTIDHKRGDYRKNCLY